MRIVDTKGQKCPAPLIATKRALKETTVGESFKVVTDNETSYKNLCRFLQDNNTGFEVFEAEGLWTLTITRNSGDLSHSTAEQYCSSPVAHFEKGDFVVVIASDKMGDGDDDLGQLLMGNFIMALKDLDRLPKKMVFYNNGVKLARAESPVVSHLKDLEKMGVELLLCATCISHFLLEKSIGAGTPSNMYAIAEAMTSASNIIKP